ncbi:MAG: hypothetical protein K1X91_10135 [Bacteriodetes bacterium]|nr:hypothetical protein [Bacteroidota bacterium]
MTTEDYNLWNLIIQSFAAVFTLAAVIVSLWLARKAGKPELVVTTNVVRIEANVFIGQIDMFNVGVQMLNPVNTSISYFYIQVPFLSNKFWWNRNQKKGLNQINFMQDSNIPPGFSQSSLILSHEVNNHDNLF